MAGLTVIPRPSVAISGTTGAQQRDRFALSKSRPYRWRGIPGWNPAAALGKWRSATRGQRPCPACGAKPYEKCRRKDGTAMPRDSHTGR